MKSKKTSKCRLLAGITFAILLAITFRIELKAESLTKQSIVVTGVVTDKGEPIPGVNVVVKGTLTGVITDTNGRYNITVPDRNAVLVFSFIGYKTHEFLVGDQTQVNIALEEETHAIEEVVVVGYGTVKKKDVTGSVSSINDQKITENAILNTQQAIQGRVAGVDVFGGGTRPGDAPTVRIRGRRSFKATSDPLYVIDGIPSSANISEINPYDIESIDILKDASATAIYGSRGANGVILITTKRGKSGKAKVSFNGYYAIQQPLKMVKMMNGPEYLEMCREARRSMEQYIGDAPSLDQDKKTWPYTKNDPFVVKNIQNAYDSNGVYHPEMIQSFDWMDYFIDTGTLQNYQLSISGGGESTKVSFNLGYQDNDGMVEGQDYKTYFAKLAIDQIISDRIKVGGTLSFSYFLQNRGYNAMDLAFRMSPLSVPWDENGNLILRPGNDDTYTNPVYNMNGGKLDERKSYRIMGSFFGELKITDDIRYRLNVGGDYRPYRQGVFSGTYSTDNKGSFPTATYSGESRFNFTLENLLFYNKQIGIHSIGLTLLQSIETEDRETYSEAGSEYPSEHYTFYNIGGGEKYNSMASGYRAWQMASFMGRINYGLLDRYLLTASIRYDGSSVLAPGNKWDAFPSFAVAWKINEENFFSDVRNVDELKLRLGYGVTGQSGISPYGTQGVLSRVVYSFDKKGTTGFRANTMPNPDLGWEKTAQWNLGLNIGLFDQRIKGTLDFYRQNTSDLLMDRQLSPVTGYSSVVQNIGKTRNTGFEIGLSGVIIQTEDFSWTADVMIYRNKEEIVELYGGKNDDTGNKWFIGYPVGTYYDYKFTGIWQTEDQELMALYKANGDNNAKPGYIRRYDKPDENGEIDYKYTDNDKVILGSDAPDWTGSISTNIRYKGFDFNCYFYTRRGQMITSSVYTNAATLFGRYNVIKMDYWTPTNPSNTMPRPYANQEKPENNGVLQYRDGSFTKLKTVTLGYTLPDRITHAMKMSNLRFYISINNAYMWSDFDGFDPENNTGFESPTPRTFLLGVNLNF